MKTLFHNEPWCDGELIPDTWNIQNDLLGYRCVRCGRVVTVDEAEELNP